MTVICANAKTMQLSPALRRTCVCCACDWGKCHCPCCCG